MKTASTSVLSSLVAGALGEAQAAAALDVLAIDPGLAAAAGPTVSRAVFAMAMTVALFDGLLHRAPTAGAYVADVARAGEAVTFDHGALRTIRFADSPTGALGQGEAAFTRILAPLGYRLAGVYPLDRLKMTGRAYAQADLPQAVPQVFLSELHVERFSDAFQAAAHRVFDSSVDPLGAEAREVLTDFEAGRPVSPDRAAAALPQLVSAFDRHHADPALADYETLLAESPEAAWIATEGSAFNHATDRVADVDALASAQRALGRPMKDAIEISGSGRVRQTAFKADPVVRRFVAADGATVERTVPGSFYEFISRDPMSDDPERLDLSFDSSNAQGIFKMTRTG